MAQHGYLGEGFGMHGDYDPDLERERERRWRNRDEDRRFMFEDRDRFGERGSDAGEWFGGRSREERGMSRYGPEHGYGGFQGDFSGGREQGGFGGRGDYERGRTSFSSHPDDHYRSWRQKQIDALDRDYADYCREREQQFHQEFDSWRRNRQGRASGQQSGATSQSDELLLNRTASGTTTEAPQEPQGTVDADSAATMGAGAAERSGRGRR